MAGGYQFMVGDGQDTGLNTANPSPSTVVPYLMRTNQLNGQIAHNFGCNSPSNCPVNYLTGTISGTPTPTSGEISQFILFQFPMALLPTPPNLQFTALLATTAGYAADSLEWLLKFKQ